MVFTVLYAKIAFFDLVTFWSPDLVDDVFYLSYETSILFFTLAKFAR